MIKKPTVLSIFFFLFLFTAIDISISAQGQPHLSEALFSQLIQKLSPISATVIKIEGDTLILDRGSIHGVEKGDLFQIFSKGEPFKGAGDERTIGYLKKPISIVRVTKTRQEKAWTKVISGKGPFFTGLPATRFSDMKAIIVKDNAQWFAPDDAKKITTSLSALEWNLPIELKPGEFSKDIFAALDTEIVILAGPASLKVYSPGPSLIYQHEFKLPTVIKPDNKTYSLKNEGIESFFLETSKKKLIGSLAEPSIQVQVADLDDKEGEEIIYLLPHGIFISSFKKSGTSASYNFTGPARPVSFSLSPEGNWIAVNLILDEIGMKSVLLRYENGKIKEVQDSINMWLYFKNDGKLKDIPELLGQSFDNVSNFGTKVFQLKATESGIEYQDATYFPVGANIANSVSFDLNGNQTPELIVINIPLKISIFENDKLIWSSKRKESEPTISIAYDITPILTVREVNKNCFLFVEKEKGDHISRLCWAGDKYEVFKATTALGDRINGIAIIEDKLLFSVTRASKTLLYSIHEIR